jgi:predicted aspartyl protease
MFATFAALAVAACVNVAVAAVPVVAPAVPMAAPDDDTDEPVYVTASTPDRVGRVMAPIYVNGQGPFAFIVDTGASRSVLAPRLVGRLGLVADGSRPLDLRGMTGAASVASVAIDELRVGELRLRDQRLPSIVSAVLADADGILGVDGLRGMCLSASFVESRVSISRNGCPKAVRDWPRAHASLKFGGLAVVRARVGGVRVQAIVDTGAERSLGNPELMRALGVQVPAGEQAVATQVLGATEHRVDGIIRRVPRIELGEFQVTDLDVTFGDLDVFRLWGLDREPAVVLGMDVLGQADGLAIDYRRARVYLQPPGGGEFTGIDRHAAPGRLPRSR